MTPLYPKDPAKGAPAIIHELLDRMYSPFGVSIGEVRIWQVAQIGTRYVAESGKRRIVTPQLNKHCAPADWEYAQREVAPWVNVEPWAPVPSERA